MLRATEIARLLTTSGVRAGARYGLGPLPVRARGGQNALARQKNRRTEIILTPKLDELFQILDSDTAPHSQISQYNVIRKKPPRKYWGAFLPLK